MGALVVGRGACVVGTGVLVVGKGTPVGTCVGGKGCTQVSPKFIHD